VTSLNENVGGTLAGAVWVGFGALAVGMLLPHVTWQIVAYAALSLTLIRMVPVAIAMRGTGPSSRPSPSWDGSVLAAWPPSCSR
jgi:membrane protein implicated in regulation of membrane protease activity